MSGRTIDTATAQAAAAPVVRPVDLALFDCDSGPVRVTGAPYDIWYDLDGDGEAEQWVSLLGQGQVSGAGEGTELQSYNLECVLSGIPLEVVSLALNEPVQGRPAYLWRALLDEGHSIVGRPLLIFAGRMDIMPLEIGSTAQLKLTVENRLADWDRVRGGRYTDAEQQNRCPGDVFFQFTAQACDSEPTWGRA